MLLFENVPTLDLHGMDRDYAKLLVKEFLNDAKKMHQERLVIIHGKGSGILKRTVHETLAKNSSVERYELDLYNDGCTLVKLRKY